MPPTRRLRFRATLAAVLLSSAVGAGAGPPPRAPTATVAPPRRDHLPGEVVLRVRDPRTGRIAVRRKALPDGTSVPAAARALARRPAVVSATPNYIARASYIPDDPGRSGTPGGWQAMQWNLLPGTG